MKALTSLRMIFRYWLHNRRDFAIYATLQILATVLLLFIPSFVADIVASLDLTESVSQWATPDSLLFNLVVILALATLSFLVSRTARITGARIAARSIYYVRKDIQDAIYRQSFSYFDKIETGQLIARATSDVDQVDPLFGMGIVMGFQSVFQLVGVIFAVWLLAAMFSVWEFAWIFTIFIPASLIGSLYLTAKLRPIYLESREAFGALTSTIRENIVGTQVVRMFGTQAKELGKFSSNNKRFYDASVKSTKFNSIFMPFNFMLLGGMILLTLFIGGNLILNNGMDLAILLTVQSYVTIVIFPLVMLGQLFIMYVQADAALTRIREVLESTPSIVEDAHPISAKSIRGEVTFDHVAFGYTPSNRVLNDITFHVTAGTQIAILGTTGSGKSTIINLLPRFYDVNDGHILVDGIDVKKYKLQDLRRHIGVVSQDVFLFDKSIKENIALGKDDATMEEIVHAATIADIIDFIETLPDKYDTRVGERGMDLSGGQKQRLSIARALVIRPKILILDDSTSSVDVETEYKIQQALEEVMRDTTTIIITQRISTIRNADQIMVLDKGRVVGLGTHEELIQSNVLYRQIYETLLKKQKKLIAVPESGTKEGSLV
ncbi:MAG: ABC transporter [Promethearchaeota archaeon CR_4]|nr:MAG: ABC transporter [Candidatus Lokiarchaeota archaeon CR_4]